MLTALSQSWRCEAHLEKTFDYEHTGKPGFACDPVANDQGSPTKSGEVIGEGVGAQQFSEINVKGAAYERE